MEVNMAIHGSPEQESRARTDDLLAAATKLREVAKTLEDEGEKVRAANQIAHRLNPWSEMAAAGSAICGDMHGGFAKTCAEVRRQADYLEYSAGLYTDLANQSRVDVT
jgi:hypothetical protein